jgi:hypothetical protein
VSRTAGLAAVLALAAACGGPRPAVESVRTDPSPRAAHVLVTVAIRNSGGEGQASVSVTLRDRTTGRVVGKEEFPVEIAPGERLSVTREVAVADGTDVTAEARAEYPPE